MNWCLQLVSFGIGFLASFLVGQALTYWQFNKSIAGYRLNKVILATREIIKTKASKSYTGPSRNRYRYSLGVIIDGLIGTYGTKEIKKRKDLLPPMIHEEGDGWETFNKYVRPVLNDLNAYSFIGSLIFIPKMRKLKTLIALCEQFENITGELDAIRELAKSEKVEIFEFQGGAIKICRTDNQKIIDQVDNLLKENDLLEERWKKWLKLIE